jgi:hypothetical protein
MPGSRPLRDLVAALSLANLMFLRLWMKMLPFKSGSGYTQGFSPFNSYLSAMLNVLLLGGIFFLMLRQGGRNAKAAPWVVFTLSGLTCVSGGYGLGLSLFSLSRLVALYGSNSVLYLKIACGLAVAAAGLLMLRYPARLARLCLRLALVLAPFLLVTFGQSVAALAKLEPAARFNRHRVDPAAALANPLKTGAVWMIFDETDYRICFEKRPAELALPAFDSFRENALWSTSAYSPSDATAVSLPALLTGIPLKSVTPVGARRLDLIRAGSLARLDFASQQNIFGRVKARGGSSALFGWYHPYSRVMHGVDLCRDYPWFNFCTSDSLPAVLLYQWAEVLDFRFNPFKNSVQGDNHIRIVQQMQADVLAAVRDQNPTLMFMHYPLPHLPAIYHRESGVFGTNRNIREGYLDNMALADRYLADLRREMERKGTWDDALIVISSDHHWRSNTYDGTVDFEHVPFMVKFPHQKKGFTYRGKFNTVLTQDLILAVLDGQVRTPQEASLWLDRNSGKLPDGKVIFSVNQPDTD